MSPRWSRLVPSLSLALSLAACTGDGDRSDGGSPSTDPDTDDPGDDSTTCDDSATCEDEPAVDFYSSFEAADPQPTWSNTVETDADGNKKASGVSGQSGDQILGTIMDRVAGVTASGENPPGEIATSIADGELTTKWLVFAATGWVQIELTEPVAVRRYAVSSANDAPERDPMDWTLQGSQDGVTWTDIDARTDQSFPSRFHTIQYDFANDTAYLHYRLDVTRNAGGGILQIAELQLSDGDDTPPEAIDMRSMAGAGPGASWNAKLSAGFTGVRAFRYGGSVIAKGRGYSYNKIFEVDVLVTPTSELSYLLFADEEPTDLSYPSTYAAVDLRVRRRHLPQRARRRRPARRGARSAGSGRLAHRLSQRVEPPRVAHRRRRRRQDHQAHPHRLRQPERAGGVVRRLDRRHPHRRRAGRAGAGAPVGPGAHHARHQLERRLLARQQLPGHRGAARLQLLDAGDRRRLAELALHVSPHEQRRQPARAAGAQPQPRAQPVDGRPADLPGDAVGGERAAGRGSRGARPPLPPRQRDRPPPPVQRRLRERHARRDGADRSRGHLPLHLPGRRRQRHLRQRRQPRRPHPRSGRRLPQRLLRRGQRPVGRRHAHVHLRCLRQPGDGKRHAAGRRRPGRDRLLPLRRRRRSHSDHADRHVAHQHRAGAAQPGPGDRADRHARHDRGASPGAVGREARHRRGGGRQRRSADDALLQPVPAFPVPELRLREHRHGGEAGLPARQPGLAAGRTEHADPHRRAHRRLASSTSTTASGTPTGPPGRPTPCWRRARPAR